LKTINYVIIQPIKKFFKGCFALTAIYLFLASSVFLFDSCKKTETSVVHDGKAKSRFLTAIRSYKAQLGSTKLIYTPNLNEGITFNSRKSYSGKLALLAPDPSNPTVEPVYLDFPQGTTPENISMVYQITSVQQLADLQNSTNAVIQYSPTPENSNNQVQVHIDALNNSLIPLINESKQYLYAKGLTEQNIQDMLLEHNGKTEDLIPFVMALTNAEVQPETFSRNYLSPFVNTANAKLNANDYLMCGIVAIGADVLYSLGSSGLATWSTQLIMRSFAVVAKRFLGPIGVAIAVVSFGVCLAERND